ncbi:CPBP family intramembrane glutamic endopeptidase [Nonomuraea basaltis]|uniref:CPBP family intramembrane glutamic endopeptidase n=1 Tax=Nonomuraea basaltis TaxID=2495887 RepID=UPI00110C4B5F|nr:type II CAAX endopeptidase family protein [Nonomuraea basaltis]TMR91430.1 CPBP family intramembrane metalloprotease [Nonomuraea basaltis]
MKSRIIHDQPPPVPGRSGFRDWVRRHRLPSFFVLAFALSWWAWPLQALGISQEPGFVPAGPVLSAVIVLAVTEGRAGLRELGGRLLRWRVGWVWYAAALGLPLAVITTTTWANVALFGAPAPDLAALSWSSVALLFAIRLVNPMDGPVGEEPAWRAYAVPRLQATRSPLVSAAILGVLVALWHLPTMVIPGESLIGLPTTFLITFVYVWLFNRSGGSLLLVLLFHVTQGTITLGNIGFTGADVVRMEWLGFAAWTLVAAAVLLFDRKAWLAAPGGQR